jgi:hypothetical protein
MQAWQGGCERGGRVSCELTCVSGSLLRVVLWVMCQQLQCVQQTAKLVWSILHVLIIGRQGLT